MAWALQIQELAGHRLPAQESNKPVPAAQQKQMEAGAA